MALGLAVDDVVRVNIVLTPPPAQFRNFGILLIAGPSEVIDTSERIRQYSSIDGILGDFGNTAPEYLAALAFFSQANKPSLVLVGRWAKTATHGQLHGGLFANLAQVTLLASLQAISAGSFSITINGTPHSLTGLNFTSITNLNGAATIIQTALAGFVANSTCTWQPDALARFNLKSGTTGATSTMTYASVVGSGTDISALLKLTAASGAATPVGGIALETPLTCATILNSSAQLFGCYAFGIAQTAFGDLADADHEAISAYIEALSPSHTYWATTNDPNVTLSTSTTDLAAVYSQLAFNRTYLQYSALSPYAAFAAFAKFAVIDPNANNSMITLKFKQETGIVAETISESQAAVLNAKHCNVFVNYNNGVAILQEGVMTSGQFADTIWGADLCQNRVQNDVFNLLFTSPTKVPQTEPGMNLIQTTIEASLSAMVFNGWSAPGQWNSNGFGQLQQGMELPKGYYVFRAPLSQQAESDRAARKAPVMQCAVKLAGAVHSANVVINVNP